MTAVFFPAGTRGDGTHLLPFKRGGLVFAIETGKPIVPIAILGSRVLRARGSMLGAACGVASAWWSGRPIATARRALADRDVLASRVYATIATIVDGRLDVPAPTRVAPETASPSWSRARS